MLVATLAAPAASPAAGLTLPCAFEPGQTVACRVEREREDVRGGGTGAYDVTLEVLGRGPDGGRPPRWRQRADIDALVAAASGLELAMRADERLTPTRSPTRRRSGQRWGRARRPGRVEPGAA